MSTTWVDSFGERLTRPDAAGTSDHVAFGYTYSDLRDLARSAVGIWRYPRIAGLEDYIDWATDGAIDLLLAADEAPEPIHLIHAGLKEIQRATYGISQTHGRPDVHGPGRTHRSFIVFWWSIPRMDIPVESIIEKIAVRQIMRLLTVRERAAVNALVLCDYSPPRAAHYLGITESALIQRVGRARSRFAEAWYWPDTPAGYWKRSHQVADTDERRQTRRRTMLMSLCKRNHGWDCGCGYAARLEDG